MTSSTVILYCVGVDSEGGAVCGLSVHNVVLKKFTKPQILQPPLSVSTPCYICTAFLTKNICRVKKYKNIQTQDDTGDTFK